MKINGLLKLTLLDYPTKTACTVFTNGCNLRCPFCHNSSLAEGTNNEDITNEYFFDFLSKRTGIIDGVCVTGGEPLLQNGIKAFIMKCRSLGFSIKLDTNGTLPSSLKELLDEKAVDYVAMDIKNTVEKYALTTGCPSVNTDHIMQSIELIMSSGVDYEFRTTAVKEFHDPQDFYMIAEMIKGAKRYFIQNFIDNGNNIAKNLHCLQKEELIQCKTNAEKLLSNVALRGI